MSSTVVRERSVTSYPWDILIVLDACRYDFFEKFNTIPGRLTRMWTPTSCTFEFLRQNFPGRYNITYVSGSPFVNSIRKIHGFEGAKHFTKIIDVWDFGWDDMLSTIPPWNVTKEAIKFLKDERAIIHFMQPHPPYIGEAKFDVPWLAESLSDWRRDAAGRSLPGAGVTWKSLPLPSRSANLSSSITIVPGARKKFLERIPKQKEVEAYTIPAHAALTSRVIEEDSADPSRLEKLTQWGLAYRDNLLLVLREVKKIISHVPEKRKVIVTSDHGEFLGEEGGKGWHPCATRHPILNFVPWLEVKHSRIEEKLRALGYLQV